MYRLAALALVPLLHGIARADAGLPWPTSRVPVRVTITADPPPPGVELFAAVERCGVHRLPPGSTLVLRADPRTGGAASIRVYAVPTAALNPPNGGVPPDNWFRSDNPDCRIVGETWVRGRLDFVNGPSEVVEQYRVERVEDGLQLRRVPGNTIPWWQSGPCCLVVLAAVIGLIWLGVRRARRQRASGSSS
jgi:hypothetical protein